MYMHTFTYMSILYYHHVQSIVHESFCFRRSSKCHIPRAGSTKEAASLYLLVDARDIAVQHHAPGLFCNHYLLDDPRITTDRSRCDCQ